MIVSAVTYPWQGELLENVTLVFESIKVEKCVCSFCVVFVLHVFMKCLLFMPVQTFGPASTVIRRRPLKKGLQNQSKMMVNVKNFM